VWVNQTYVIFLPRLERALEGGRVKVINFRMLYNDSGQHFPIDNRKTLVEKVEIHMGGKLYNVPVRQAD
jgi:hypothetical protein